MTVRLKHDASIFSSQMRAEFLKALSDKIQDMPEKSQNGRAVKGAMRELHADLNKKPAGESVSLATIESRMKEIGGKHGVEPAKMNLGTLCLGKAFDAAYGQLRPDEMFITLQQAEREDSLCLSDEELLDIINTPVIPLPKDPRTQSFSPEMRKTFKNFIKWKISQPIDPAIKSHLQILQRELSSDVVAGGNLTYFTIRNIMFAVGEQRGLGKRDMNGDLGVLDAIFYRALNNMPENGRFLDPLDIRLDAMKQKLETKESEGPYDRRVLETLVSFLEYRIAQRDEIVQIKEDDAQSNRVQNNLRNFRKALEHINAKIQEKLDANPPVPLTLEFDQWLKAFRAEHTEIEDTNINHGIKCANEAAQYWLAEALEAFGKQAEVSTLPGQAPT